MPFSPAFPSIQPFWRKQKTKHKNNIVLTSYTHINNGIKKFSKYLILFEIVEDSTNISISHGAKGTTTENDARIQIEWQNNNNEREKKEW